MFKLKYIFGIIFVILFVYGRFMEPNIIKISEITINNDSINPALKGKKIVHLSDLHLSGFGKFEIDLLNLINEINPDLIFLTGDYIKWNGDIKPALKFLSGLKAKYGVFAVMGDYDYSDSRNNCLFCHEKGSAHNLTMLRNSSQKINIEGKVIRLAGLDEGCDDDFEKLDIFEDKNSYLLVLSHSPLAFDKFSNEDKIFMFAGDTHGGQVKLPLWVFRLFGYEKNVKYNYGLFRKGNKIMYVTRGIGTSHFKFRLFCPPEIAVIQF